jgi:hypothetical protein
VEVRLENKGKMRREEAQARLWTLGLWNFNEEEGAWKGDGERADMRPEENPEKEKWKKHQEGLKWQQATTMEKPADRTKERVKT